MKRTAGVCLSTTRRYPAQGLPYGMGDQRSTTGPNQPRLQHGTAAPAPRASDAGERQPLLSGSAPAASPPSPRTPLPWRSIAILMVVRFAEPVASTVGLYPDRPKVAVAF